MKKHITIITMLVASLSLTACMTSSNAGEEEFPKTPYTSGNVSMTLKKGVTTKDQVIESFGSPNIVTQNANGQSVWTYQTNATVVNSSQEEGYISLVVSGQNQGFMQSQKTMTIIITFQGNVVSDFKSMSTNF